MLNNLYSKKHFWKYATLFFSLMFFILDEIFILGLSLFPEEHQLLFHRTALFFIVVSFITWTQYALHHIQSINNKMLQTAKLATLGEMAASVAHEIVRPIANVDLKVQMNLLKTEGDSEFIEFNQFVKKQMDKCTSLVNSLRLFGRNSEDTPKDPNSINTVIDETLKLTSPYLSFTNVTTELSDKLPPVLCNALQIEQVLANLIMNSKDAIEEIDQGIIIIRSFSKEQQIIVEVEDNGSGIPPSILNNIFDPFYTTKEVGKGTGLGLAISKRIIKEHDGNLNVDSRPGRTIFSISLVATQEHK